MISEAHEGMIVRFATVLNKRGDLVNTRILAEWVFGNFPEYRDLGVEKIEQEVTKFLYK